MNQQCNDYAISDLLRLQYIENWRWQAAFVFKNVGGLPLHEALISFKDDNKMSRQPPYVYIYQKDKFVDVCYFDKNFQMSDIRQNSYVVFGEGFVDQAVFEINNNSGWDNALGIELYRNITYIANSFPTIYKKKYNSDSEKSDKGTKIIYITSKTKDINFLSCLLYGDLQSIKKEIFPFRDDAYFKNIQIDDFSRIIFNIENFLWQDIMFSSEEYFKETLKLWHEVLLNLKRCFSDKNSIIDDMINELFLKKITL